tara:strand:- start:161 stop:547 length:387 start_codon:yes stop_codon:yes gene_type:complete
MKFRRSFEDRRNFKNKSYRRYITVRIMKEKKDTVELKCYICSTVHIKFSDIPDGLELNMENVQHLLNSDDDHIYNYEHQMTESRELLSVYIMEDGMQRLQLPKDVLFKKVGDQLVVTGLVENIKNRSK